MTYDAGKLKALERIADALDRIADADQLRNELLIDESVKRDKAWAEEMALRRADTDKVLASLTEPVIPMTERVGPTPKDLIREAFVPKADAE